MEITVRIKNVYGNRVVYPACSKSEMFASIAGTTSLTHHTIECIKALGYKVVVEQQVLEVL